MKPNGMAWSKPNDDGLQRRGLLKLGTLASAATAVVTLSGPVASRAQAAAPTEISQFTYIPSTDKGVAFGVATLDSGSKLPLNQIPDLSNSYAPATVDGKEPIRKGTLTVDARDYGVQADGTTDDTPYWMDAITSAWAGTIAASATVTILAPPGVTIVSGIDTLSRVSIKGHSRGTTIKLKAGSNRPVIRTSSAATQGTYIGNLTIDGNKAEQAGGVSHGIHLNNSQEAINPSFIKYASDAFHIIDDLLIANCDGSGIKTDGRGETQINRVRSLSNTRYGFHINSFDTWLTDTSAGMNSLDGYYVTMPNVALTSCKGFMNRNGIRMEGSHVRGCVVNGFIAQGNYEHGVSLIQVTDSFIEAVSFDNNYGSVTGTVWSGLAASGARRNRIILNSYRNEKPTSQVAALYLTPSSSENIIDVTTDGVLPLHVSGSNLRGNSIRTTSTSGFAIDTFSASYIPNLSDGNTRQITLTANMMLNAPTGPIVEGQTLTFLFTQDATGKRTLTWGPSWMQKHWQPCPAANSTSVVTWQYCGGVWVIASGSHAEPPGVVTDTFAASYWPDTSTGYTRAMTLTGILTVNRPTTAVNGQVLTFIFTQDAIGGRTISWGSGWVQKWWQPSQAANAISSVRWIYWGGNWNFIGGTYRQAAAPTIDRSVVDAIYGREEQAVIASLRTAVSTLTAAMKANGILS